MKNLFIYIIMAFVITALVSCEDSISPKGSVPDKYGVNLILRGDTTLQTAYIEKVYNVDGYDPYTLSEDPFVEGAIITINYTDSQTLYTFRDTTDETQLNERYNTPARYYYLKNFRPQYGKEVEMNITFPDGSTASSVTTVPEGIAFDEVHSTSYVPGSVRTSDSTYIEVIWTNSSLEKLKARTVTLVYYHKEESGELIKYTKPVPYSLESVTGSNTPLYTSVSIDNYFNIDKSLLKKTLEEISEGDPVKGRYQIAPLEINIYLFDDYLTEYYQSSQYFEMGFTVRSNPADISNIENCYGYFAAFSFVQRKLKFDLTYLLDNFGYIKYTEDD